MLQDQLVAGKGEDMRSFLGKRLVDGCLVAMLGITDQVIGCEGSQATGFRMRNIRIEKRTAHDERASRNFSIRSSLLSAA